MQRIRWDAARFVRNPHKMHYCDNMHISHIGGFYIERNHIAYRTTLYGFSYVLYQRGKYRFEGTPSHSISPIREYRTHTHTHTYTASERMCAVLYHTNDSSSPHIFGGLTMVCFRFGFSIMRSVDSSICVHCVSFEQFEIVHSHFVTCDNLFLSRITWFTWFFHNISLRVALSLHFRYECKIVLFPRVSNTRNNRQ